MLLGRTRTTRPYTNIAVSIPKPIFQMINVIALPLLLANIALTLEIFITIRKRSACSTNAILLSSTTFFCFFHQLALVVRLLTPQPAAFGIGNIARADALVLAAGGTPAEKLIQHASHRIPRRASYFGALYQ